MTRRRCRNIRILDPNIVSGTYTQLQQRQNFYGFPSQLAIDQYKVDGELRDYVVAVRRSIRTGWPGIRRTGWRRRTMVSSRLRPIRSASGSRRERHAGSGEPDFVVGDPATFESTKKNSPIRVTEPRIYFGELIAKGTRTTRSSVPDNAPAREYDTENTSTPTRAIRACPGQLVQPASCIR